MAIMKNIGGKPKVLLRGSTSVPYAAGTTTTDIDVSAAGITDQSKVIEVCTGWVTTPLSSYNGVSLRLTSAANLRIVTYSPSSSGMTYVVEWEIRQSFGRVQRGYTSVAAAASATTHNVPIVDVGKTYKAKVYDNGADGGCIYGVHARRRLTSATNLELGMSGVNTATYNIAWVIEY